MLVQLPLLRFVKFVHKKLTVNAELTFDEERI